MGRRTYALIAAILAATVALAGGALVVATAHDKQGTERERFRPRLDAGTMAVLEEIRDAVTAKAPDIAKPVLDKAVSDGDISQEQADRLAKLVAHKRLARADMKALFSDTKAAPVWFEVQAALAREVPGIVKPITDKAVADKKLTQAQADGLVAGSAWHGMHPFFDGPRGHGMRGPGRPGRMMPPPPPGTP